MAASISVIVQQHKKKTIGVAIGQTIGRWQEVKNGKKPTLAQKKLLHENGLVPENWLIVKDTTEMMEVVSRSNLQKKSKKTKIIRKAKK